MNGKDLLIDLGNISHKYYEEAENETFMEIQKHKTIRRPLLVAAIIALTMLLVGCGAAIYMILAEEPWARRMPSSAYHAEIFPLSSFSPKPP